MGIKSKSSENQTSTQQTGLRFWLPKLFILCFSAFWVLALMIRLTVRDSGGVVPTLVFYTTPLILLSLGATLVFVLAWSTHWYRISLVWFLLSLLTGIWCWNSQFRSNVLHPAAQAQNRPDLRVLFWNIGDRLWGMDVVLEELKTIDADLIGLVEAGTDSADMKQFWQDSFPDHPFQVVKNGFVFLSRIPVSNQNSGTLTEMGRFERVDLKWGQEPGGGIAVCLVDIKSDIFRSRKKALLELATQVSQIPDQPILVLGDFNTPSDSDHFRPLRKLLKNTFEIAGDGYMATWPLPLPVLDLDSIWVNDHVTAVDSRNRWTWTSDHRPVVTDIIVKSLKQD
tara:strand:+ start:908 stop:1924 length:1017 start_codon:yes stop_codon:yes gene_type:complete